jgi:hypothetical protein
VQRKLDSQVALGYSGAGEVAIRRVLAAPPSMSSGFQFR